jgi:hypothetical protein
MFFIQNLVSHQVVVETTIESWTGPFLYSDYSTENGQADYPRFYAQDSLLNKAVRLPFVGIFAGITRVALGIIHSFGHLIAASLTFKKGHLFHALKGGCETVRGLIEFLPIIGRLFAYSMSTFSLEEDGEGRRWWMMKIFNPRKIDGIDCWEGQVERRAIPSSSSTSFKVEVIHRYWESFASNPFHCYVKA